MNALDWVIILTLCESSSEGLQNKLIRQIVQASFLDNHSKFDTQSDFVQTLYHVIELVKENFKQNNWRSHGT